MNNRISPVGYLIVKTAEECGEAIQAISKILLHGADATWDRHKKTNMEVLSEELADVAVHIAVLLDMEVLDRKLWNAKFAAREEIVLKKMKELATAERKEKKNNNSSDGRKEDSQRQSDEHREPEGG